MVEENEDCPNLFPCMEITSISEETLAGVRDIEYFREYVVTCGEIEHLQELFSMCGKIENVRKCL